MSEQQEQVVERDEQGIGPGRHLREARESRNLTMEQAATQLRMQLRIIEALEKADVDRADDLMKEQKKKSLEALQHYMVQRSTGSPEMLEEIWQKQAGK